MQHPPLENIDSDEALARDNRALAYYEPQINQAVQMAAGGMDPQQALTNLLSALPLEMKAAVSRRFQFELDKIRHARAAKKREEEDRALQAKQNRFSIRQAALLMAAGTFEKIRNALKRRPGLERTVQQLGETMMHHGVKPDATLIERLEQVQSQAQLPNRTQTAGRDQRNR